MRNGAKNCKKTKTIGSENNETKRTLIVLKQCHRSSFFVDSFKKKTFFKALLRLVLYSKDQSYKNFFCVMALMLWHKWLCGQALKIGHSGRKQASLTQGSGFESSQGCWH